MTDPTVKDLRTYRATRKTLRPVESVKRGARIFCAGKVEADGVVVYYVRPEGEGPKGAA